MSSILDQPSMGDLQQCGHGAGHNYAKGSPHILHHSIRDRLVQRIHQMVGDVMNRNGRCRVLEVGAGHGCFTDHLLAAGAEVEVTEMSAPSAEFLRHRFRHNRKVVVVHDPDGDATRAGDPVDAVVCISVLHHIPDYLGTTGKLAGRVAPGGAFLSFQDPLWYPRRSALSMALDRGSYLCWRLVQGEFRRGLSTRIRRISGTYDEANPSDMVEYHVVRNGVDEEAIRSCLAASFSAVDVERYWSTQSCVLQAMGERFFPASSFGILARGRI
ncbi:class I SAM-dependent methyltransferase [Streptomyces sp. NPDC093568]|uniref:class I SAM-dependent methyltransferase n=1 Tax=Streptomyces sp. NPDC093568 TaxID=3366041 RepID=UPI00380CBAC9